MAHRSPGGSAQVPTGPVGVQPHPPRAVTRSGAGSARGVEATSSGSGVDGAALGGRADGAGGLGAGAGSRVDLGDDLGQRVDQAIRNAERQAASEEMMGYSDGASAPMGYTRNSQQSTSSTNFDPPIASFPRHHSLGPPIGDGGYDSRRFSSQVPYSNGSQFNEHQDPRRSTYPSAAYQGRPSPRPETQDYPAPSESPHPRRPSSSQHFSPYPQSSSASASYYPSPPPPHMIPSPQPPFPYPGPPIQYSYTTDAPQYYGSDQFLVPVPQVASASFYPTTDGPPGSEQFQNLSQAAWTPRSGSVVSGRAEGHFEPTFMVGQEVYGSDGSPATKDDVQLPSMPFAAIPGYPAPSTPFPYYAPTPPSAPYQPMYSYPVYPYAYQYPPPSFGPNFASPPLQQHQPGTSMQYGYDDQSRYTGQYHLQPPQAPPQFAGPPSPYGHAQDQFAYPSPRSTPQPNYYPTQSYASPPPASAPLPYAPPSGLARGHLAQAKFRDAVFDREGHYPLEKSNSGTSEGGGAQGGGGSTSARLPKPPPHSPHALWVGNVPSDATHAELWTFFMNRPLPITIPRPTSVLIEGVDLYSPGIESIHVIGRSNCAFVNFVSDLHLQHAIAVSHGTRLRPWDLRGKELVCRLRKKEEDQKSGVGAQRGGGMHVAYVASQRAAAEAETGAKSPERPREPVHSHSSTSTSSGFLSRHFAKRFFVLKSHAEEDLNLSIERGLWATQAHNEGVLDQAVRTCRDGVYLVFGVNKAGEWYGYAKMTSPIFPTTSDSRSTASSRSSTHADMPVSPGFRSSHSATRPETSLQSQTIPEDEEAIIDPTKSSSVGKSPLMLFSPSEHRTALASPLSMTPSPSITKTPSRGIRGSSAPPEMTLAKACNINSTAATDEVASMLHLPADSPVPDPSVGEERSGESLDPKVLEGMEGMRLEGNGVRGSGSVDSMDSLRRGESMEGLSAEERNASLEKLEEGDGAKGASLGGTPFKIEWIKVHRLPFAHTRNLFNSFNSNREVKVSRDGTEIEPAAGLALLEAFWKDEEVPPTSSRVLGITTPSVRVTEEVEA